MELRNISSKQFSSLIKGKPASRFPLINAVTAGIQTGKIFIADRSETSEAFVLHKAGFSILHSERASTVNEFLEFFENSDEIPAYFHIYDPPDFVMKMLLTRSDVFGLKNRTRIQLKFRDRTTGPESPKFNVSGKLRVSVIDESNLDSLLALGLDIGARFWDSNEDFLQNGIGVCILDQKDNPVSVCYSACVAEGIAEIDVKTDDQYRGQGFARTIVREFVRLSLNEGIIPNWDCFKENIASVKTALSTGFGQEYEYQFLSVFNKLKQVS